MAKSTRRYTPSHATRKIPWLPCPHFRQNLRISVILQATYEGCYVVRFSRLICVHLCLLSREVNIRCINGHGSDPFLFSDHPGSLQNRSECQQCVIIAFDDSLCCSWYLSRQHFRHLGCLVSERILWITARQSEKTVSIYFQTCLQGHPGDIEYYCICVPF